jgi:hypothetical protein
MKMLTALDYQALWQGAFFAALFFSQLLVVYFEDGEIFSISTN